LTDRAEAKRGVLCKHLDVKALFIAMLCLYAATHREMKNSLLDITEGDPTEGNEEFREQGRRKWIPSYEEAKRLKKKVMAASGLRDLRMRSQGKLPTRNFFASMRATEMEVDCTLVEESTEKPDRKAQQASSSKSGRPPPIMLTSIINLMQLQRQIKGFVTGNFEFRNTRSETRIVMKEMADFSAIKTNLEKSNLSYFTLFLSLKNTLKP
jgi:hypothetical protein